MLDHARPTLAADDWRTRALLQFAGEEAKHIQLFKAFQREFETDFSTPCATIGPPEATHPRFPAALDGLGPSARAEVEAVAPSFC